MELLAFTLLYGAGVVAFLFVMLCGEAAMFADTPVAWMHWAVTSAPCSACEFVPVDAAVPPSIGRRRPAVPACGAVQAASALCWWEACYGGA